MVDSNDRNKLIFLGIKDNAIFKIVIINVDLMINAVLYI